MATCQELANRVKELENVLQKTSNQEKQQEIMDQIDNLNVQQQALGCFTERSVTVTFTGVVIIETDNASARGPFSKNIPTDLADCEMSTVSDPATKKDLSFVFTGTPGANQIVGIVDSPTICQQVMIGAIATIITVTLKDSTTGQTGTFTVLGDGSSAEMKLPTLTLHLHSSFHTITPNDQDVDGAVTFTTNTADAAGPFQPTGMHWDKSSGHLRLVGTTTLQGGPLALLKGTHVQLTLDGTLSPSPLS